LEKLNKRQCTLRGKNGRRIKGEKEKESIDKSRGEERRGKSDSVMQLDYLVFMYKRAPVPFDSRHIFKCSGSC